jgi:hypothetical protein
LPEKRRRRAQFPLAPSTSIPADGASQILLGVNLDGVAPGIYFGSLTLRSSNAGAWSAPLMVRVGSASQLFLPLLAR